MINRSLIRINIPSNIRCRDKIASDLPKISLLVTRVARYRTVVGKSMDQLEALLQETNIGSEQGNDNSLEK